MVGASPLAGWLYDTRRWRHYGTVGIAVVALCYIGLGILAQSWSNLVAMAGIFVLLGMGSALFQSPNSTEVMNSLPRGQTAIASSVSAAVRNLGMTLGVALASLLLPLQLRMFGSTGERPRGGKGPARRFGGQHHDRKRRALHRRHRRAGAKPRRRSRGGDACRGARRGLPRQADAGRAMSFLSDARIVSRALDRFRRQSVSRARPRRLPGADRGPRPGA